MSVPPEHGVVLLSFAPHGGTRRYETRCACGWTSGHHERSGDAQRAAASHLASLRQPPRSQPPPG